MWEFSLCPFLHQSLDISLKAIMYKIDIIAVTICLFIGLSFVGYGVAQDMFLIPFLNTWSDIGGYLAGLAFLALAWMLYIDANVKPSFGAN